MTCLTSLYSEAEIFGIDVSCIDSDNIESLSILSDSGNCYIGINPFSLVSTADELVHLAHEIGHCQTGAFYNRYSSLDVRAKHERRANIWAIKKLIPKDEFVSALSRCTNLYELADHFQVTLPFMQLATEYYASYVSYRED